jgi:2-aminoadipate transaminase
MLVLLQQPNMISFALGLPAPEFFPLEELAQAMENILSLGPKTLQYNPSLPVLKSHIVELMKGRGVSCHEDQIFLTGGAQQGISLLAHLFLEQRRQVVSEELIYTGFQQVLLPFQADKLTVPTDPDSGMEVDAVRYHLERGNRPAFIYAITEGHNPCGVSMHPDKRSLLVDLSRDYQVPIIEDDAYGFLSYDNKSTPALRALDEKWVCYVGSFSKTLAPALRVGWLVVSEELMIPLSIIKESIDINSTTLAQRLVQNYLDMGRMPARLNKLRREYQTRRDAMLAALQEHLPSQSYWRKPENGFFVWVKLPESFDVKELLEISIETEQVAFIPGDAFRVREDGPWTQYVRLNFSHCTPEIIAEGVQRLGRALRHLQDENVLARAKRVWS